MPTIEGAGVELAYEEVGSGPTVVLVHGMAADRTVFRPVLDELDGEARAVALDRRGYGESGAPEPYERTTVAEQAEDLADLVRALAPDGALACGVDFGALVVLDVLRRHRGVLHAAALVDPPVFQLVPDALEPLAAERLALEEALRDAGPGRAVELWLASRGAADPERVRRARRDTAGFFADYGGQASLALSRRDLRGLAVPVAVLDAPRAPRHVRAAADAVARLLPDARRAGAEDVVEILRALLARAPRSP